MTRARLALVAALALLLTPLSVVLTSAPAQAAVTVFPVPTSAAGLGRITTAPDGSMWFLEQDANKVGRITASGQITEYALPAVDSSVDGPAKGLDVGADGTVWVTTDYGDSVTRLAPSGQLLSSRPFPPDDPCVGGVCPYAGAIRVANDGVAWIAMNYDRSFVARVTPNADYFESANAPACDDVLGKAADGTIWCQNGAANAQNSITRLNADASGGTSYPLPADATYPNALAAGPVGSIWFTRSSTDGTLTLPSRGSVGYLDAATGATRIWQTGSRTAPEDLVKGPDNQMWFTNGGSQPAIGHISADGVGAITAVGNYSPESLTFGPDGAIWFTDAKNNVIVRVTTDQLQTTTIDLGEGVTMIAPGVTPPPPAGAKAAGALPKVKGVLPVRKGKVKVAVRCPATAAAGCAGRVGLDLAKGGKALAKPKAYQAGAGKKATVTVKLTKRGLKRLRVGKVVKVRVELTAAGSSKVVSSRVVKVRRR